jgi:hypothetical protein
MSSNADDDRRSDRHRGPAEPLAGASGLLTIRFGHLAECPIL